MNTRSTIRSGGGYVNPRSRANIIRDGGREEHVPVRRNRSSGSNPNPPRRRPTARASRRSTRINTAEEVQVVHAATQLDLGPRERRDIKLRKLQETERKLVRSCEHVILLNDKIRGLTIRYRSAREEGFKSFRYNLRIRLAAVEGVRNMYYEYARDRAEEVAELRKDLYDQNVEIVTASDVEDEEDTYSDMADTDQSFTSDEESDGEEYSDVVL